MGLLTFGSGTSDFEFGHPRVELTFTAARSLQLANERDGSPLLGVIASRPVGSQRCPLEVLNGGMSRQVLLLQKQQGSTSAGGELRTRQSEPVRRVLHAPGILEREFDDGWAGAVHDQDNYISYLSLSVGDNELDQFFASIDEAGFTQQGQANAIDISLVKPEDS
jgi:hypothetical protein